MADTLEYILSLKDQMSARLATIGINSQEARTRFDALTRQTRQSQQTMTNFGGSLGALREKLNLLRSERDWIPTSQMQAVQLYTSEIKKLEGEIQKLEGTEEKASKGITAFGVAAGQMIAQVGMRVVSMVTDTVKQGVEKAEAFHQAEAQLRNTMQNRGTYSTENFEKAIAGAQQLSQHVKASAADIINMQAQIRMVGSASDDMVNKMSQAALDLSAKKGFDPTEAASMIAKAVNDPDSLMRLNKTLLIDPAIIEKIQDLSKAGHTAQAQMALLGAVEKQVGGAAEAAFNADPMAAFQKAMSGLQRTLGNVVIDLETKLGPALTGIVQSVTSNLPVILEAIKPVFDELAKLPIGNIIQLIAQLAVPVMRIVVPALHVAIQIFNQLFNAIQPTLQALMPIFGALAFAIQNVINVVGGLVQIIITHLAPLFNAQTRLFGTVLTPILMLIGKVIGWIGFILKPLLDAFMKLFDVVSWVFNKIADFFDWIGKKLGVSSATAGATTGDSFIDGFNLSMANFNPTAQVTKAIQAEDITKIYAAAGVKNAAAYKGAIEAQMKTGWVNFGYMRLYVGQPKIAPSTVPGQQPVSTAFGNLDGTGGGTDKSKSNNAVATGGQKSITVNMTIGRMFEGFKVIGNSVAEAAQNARDMVVEHMTQAVSIGAGLAGAN